MGGQSAFGTKAGDLFTRSPSAWPPSGSSLHGRRECCCPSGPRAVKRRRPRPAGVAEQPPRSPGARPRPQIPCRASDAATGKKAPPAAGAAAWPVIPPTLSFGAHRRALEHDRFWRSALPAGRLAVAVEVRHQQPLLQARRPRHGRLRLVGAADRGRGAAEHPPRHDPGEPPRRPRSARRRNSKSTPACWTATACSCSRFIGNGTCRGAVRWRRCWRLPGVVDERVRLAVDPARIGRLIGARWRRP